MERYAGTASVLILSIFLSFGYTGAQSITLAHDSAQVGKSLTLECSLNPSGSYSLYSVNWKLNNYTNAIKRDATNCDPLTLPSEYEISRYTFSCSQSKFTMTINQLQQSDDHTCWTCSVVFGNGTQIDGTKCIIFGSSTMPQTTLKYEKENLTTNQKIGIGVGCGVGALIILFVAVIIYWRKKYSIKASSTQDHQNSCVEDHQLKQQSENK